MSAWTLTYEGYDPETEGLREALCTLGNGLFATRGAAPESRADEIHYPGTYAAGVFNRLVSEVDGESVPNESMVNLPNWLALTFRIDGGAWFSIDDVEVLEYVQELDLRRAVLTRRCRFRDGEGRTTRCTQRRFVSMADAHRAALETTITADDWSGTLEVRSTIDGRVENNGVERYAALASRHLVITDARPVRDDTVLLVAETNQSYVRVATAARTRVLQPAPASRDWQRRAVAEDGWTGHDLSLTVSEGDEVIVEKVVAVYTSRDVAVSDPAVQAERALARSRDFDGLLEDHVVVWSHLWDRFCFETDDSEDSMRILRLHTLHVLQTASPHTVDLDVGVPARGLHGEAYRGHIMWDELFVFPLLNLRVPAVTRSLLRYRSRRLPEARRAAAAAGYSGAMFPWQSGSDGREESQRLHLNPDSGHWLPDPTFRQRHIGSAIAYNVWSYYQATDDQDFLHDVGAELLLEIACFWASISTYDHVRDRYVIRGVIGPDEFHTGYPDADEPGLDNNAYTNVMAVWVLRRALQTLELLPDVVRRELSERLGIGSAAIAQWEEITQKMFVPFHGDGIISQFEGYEDLEEFDWDRYEREYGDIHRLDRILEAEGDTPNRYKASKQADTLMLFYVLSADELDDIFRRLGYDWHSGRIAPTVDYYLARTSHGSTLSSVVHAWVLARAHRERALEFYERTLAADIADVQGGTTPEGVHLAAMAGSIDLLQRCFAGVEARDDMLRVNPYWPEQLGTLTFSLRYRGLPLTLHINGRRVKLSAPPGAGRTVQVAYRDEVAELGPETSLELPLGAPPSHRTTSTGRSA